MRGVHACLIALCFLGGSMACDTARLPRMLTQPSPDSISSIVITPDTAGIAGAPRFKAVATLANGQSSDITEVATWQSSDRSVIEVQPRGFAVASRLGAFTITASHQGVAGGRTVTTFPCISWTVASTHRTNVIWVGESVLWRASGYNACLMHWSGVSPKWQSLAPNIAGVDYKPDWGAETATLVGKSAGTATIVMTEDESSVETREVMWKSSNRSVATVSPIGNVLTHKVGTAIISAELSGVRTDITVQVLR